MHRLQEREPIAIKSGDKVLIGDENKKRGFWKMGIVEEQIIRKDGITCGVRVRVPGTGKSEFEQTVTEIVSFRTVGEKCEWEKSC